MKPSDNKRIDAVRKELLHVNWLEKRMEKAAMDSKAPNWMSELQGRIPQKVYTGLESAFHKAFCLIFSKGSTLIEKTYKKDDLMADYTCREYAVQLKGGRKELRKMNRSANNSNLLNLAMTTAEGVALGSIGVGMPDIVLFISTLLKGIYETALNYGFDYESEQEQLLILKMMAASMSRENDWVKKNSEVDKMLNTGSVSDVKAAIKAEMKTASSVFAMDMIVMKFIQGIPIVGIIGGAANPLYYRKVMKYVQLKYRKRYLMKQLQGR